MSRLLDTWLLRSGGQYNIAVCRMLIATALALTLHKISPQITQFDTWSVGMAGAGWTPKGLVKLIDPFLGGPPPQWFMMTVYRTAQVAIVMMAVGFIVPLSQIVAAIATTLLVSLETSFGPYWSHAYNVQLLAALAFMFGRSADVWSVDAVIRSLRRRPPTDRGRVYWWPVIFAELATALFMFGAFVQKFRETGIVWAWSDNLRNSLIISWFQYRSDAPDIALWLANHPWAWKTAGTLQLFAQSTTILAAFLVGWPLFRLVFGAGFFLVEIAALGHVFRFWHPFWVPLCFLSIDFEYFWRRFKGTEPRQSHGLGDLAPIFALLRPGLVWALSASRALARRLIAAATAAWARLPSLIAAMKPRRDQQYVVPALIFGMLFFGYYLANIFGQLGEKHLNYPFSSMAFYSETRAKKPYHRPQYWLAYTGRIDAYPDGASQPRDLWYREGSLEDRLYRATSLSDLRSIDASYVVRAKEGLFQKAPVSETGYLRAPTVPGRFVYRSGLMAIPPFPAPPGMIDMHMGYRAVRDDNGYRALMATARWDADRNQVAIAVEHEGFRDPKLQILARYDVRENPGLRAAEPLAGKWEGDTFYVANDGKARQIYTLIKVTDAEMGVSETYYGPDNFQTYR